MVIYPKILGYFSLTALESTTDDSSKVELIIGFVADSAIQSIKRPTDDDIGLWYYHVCSG